MPAQRDCIRMKIHITSKIRLDQPAVRTQVLDKACWFGFTRKDYVDEDPAFSKYPNYLFSVKFPDRSMQSYPYEFLVKVEIEFL